LSSPFSYIFFLCFLFLIVVVLMNLLNGLAVSMLSMPVLRIRIKTFFFPDPGSQILHKKTYFRSKS
jgi:hypothetical protein